MNYTAQDAFAIAQRFIGTKEAAGTVDNPLVLAMLQLDQQYPKHDEVPWCSAFVNWVCWLLRLPRSKALNARSWLVIGTPVTIDQAEVGDIVVLRRGKNPALGHVGFFAGRHGPQIEILGGNQMNQVSVAPFPVADVLSIRRIA